jgi:hypothetical protein
MKSSLSFLLAGLAFILLIKTAGAAETDQCPPVSILVRTCTCADTTDRYLYIPTLQILKSDGGFTSANLGPELSWDECKEVLSQSALCK